MALTDGWTEEANGDVTTYLDKDGNEITDWDNSEGYASICLRQNGSHEMLPVIITISGVVGVMGIIVMIYCCCKKSESDSEKNDEFERIKESS